MLHVGQVGACIWQPRSLYVGHQERRGLYVGHRAGRSLYAGHQAERNLYLCVVHGCGLYVGRICYRFIGFARGIELLNL